MRQNDETENMYPISKYVRTIKALIIALGFYCWRNVWDLDCWDLFLLETVNHSSRQDIIVVVSLKNGFGPTWANSSESVLEGCICIHSP